MSSAIDEIRRRYVAVNGEHPMTADDDRYVLTHYVPLPAAAHDDVIAGNLPLPSYLLGDGTPMVPGDYLDAVELAGGAVHTNEWFCSHWPEDEQATAADEWAAYLSGRYVCLHSGTPTTIIQKTRWTEQLDGAIERLRRQPGDTTARGSLGEAVHGLDRLLTEMTGYDRLRFDEPTVRERLVDDVRRDHLFPDPPPLPIRTERLVLRRTTPADAEAYHTYHSDPTVDRYLLGTAWSLARCRDELGRHDPDDPGVLLIVERDGEVIGDVMVAPQAPSYCQVELGWVFSRSGQGHGYSTEAARAALELAVGHYRAHRVYADLDARNDASARLCERLGMRRELHRRGDYWSRGEWTDSFEYAILAAEYTGKDLQ